MLFPYHCRQMKQFTEKLLTIFKEVFSFFFISFCRRYDSVINRLYTGIQCYSCGMRFTTSQTDVYADHLDWHYRQNRTEKDVSRKITHRRWYYSLTVSNAVFVGISYRLDSVF